MADFKPQENAALQPQIGAADMSNDVLSSGDNRSVIPGSVSKAEISDSPSLAARSELEPAATFRSLTEQYLAGETEPKIILTRLLGHLADQVSLKEKADDFPTHGLFINRQIECLEKISSQMRCDFMQSVLAATLSTGRLTPSSRNIISRMLFFCSERERLILARSLLDKALPASLDEKQAGDMKQTSLQTEASRGTAVTLMTAICQSAPGLQALARLVRGIGEGSLWEIKDTQLRNIVALVELRARLSSVKLPRLLCTRRPKQEQVQNKLSQIAYCLQYRLQILQEHPAQRFFRTAIYKQLKRIIGDNLRLLRQERSRLKRTKERYDFANMLLKKIKLELDSTLMLSTEARHKSKQVAHWTAATLGDVQAALKKFPLQGVLFTPRLRQIRLMSELNGAYGQRDSSGLVKLSAAVAEQVSVYQHFSRTSSFRLTAYHELCHAMHYGEHGDGPKYKTSIRSLAQKSNPMTDFGEFMKLSGWEVVAPPYQVHIDTQTASINQVTYPLNTPVRMEERELVLRYDNNWRTLYLHDAYARFAAEPDARSNPWEDYAEAATEYAFAPRRLISTSPWKFLHLEQTYRLYHKDKKIKALLEKSLEEQRALGIHNADQSTKGLPENE